MASKLPESNQVLSYPTDFKALTCLSGSKFCFESDTSPKWNPISVSVLKTGQNIWQIYSLCKIQPDFTYSGEEIIRCTYVTVKEIPAT